MLDCAIIGGGPAGLSAALALSRVCRSAIVFDTGRYRNDSSLFIHNMWGGLDGKRNDDLRQITQKQILMYGTVQILRSRVDRIERENDNFLLRTADNQLFYARTILLAGGVYDVLPEIYGLREAWNAGLGIHCMFCHGYEFKGKKLFVAGACKASIHSAAGFSTLTRDIHLLTNADAGQFQSSKPDLATHARNMHLSLLEGRVRFIETKETTKQIVVHFEGDQPASTFDGFLVAPSTRPSDDLVPLLAQLSVKPTQGLHPLQPNTSIVQGADVLGRMTSLPGLYVAGDMMQLVQATGTAMSSGQMAGAAVHIDLGHSRHT